MSDIQANPSAADMELDPLRPPGHKDYDIEVGAAECSRSPIQTRCASGGRSAAGARSDREPPEGTPGTRRWLVP